jgi:hypothetical protein
MSAPAAAPGPSERELLERRYLALVELARRQSEAPLLFVRDKIRAHPKQREFLDAGRTHRRRLVLGGNRSGKSWVSRIEAIAHSLGYRFYDIPDLKLAPNGDLPPREQVPLQYWIRRHDGIPIRVPNTGMIVSGLPRLRGIGQNMFPGLHELLPEAVRSGRLPYQVLKGAQGVPDWMQLPNGSKIVFATDEQDLMTFEGFTLD